jgi:hypothetical protein
MKHLKLILVLGPVCALTGVTAVMAQQFPLWERILRQYGGTTDTTPVPTMKMGYHMQMSLPDKPQPGDQQRAQQIVSAANSVVARYSDVNAAVQDGYKPYHPTGKMGEEVHYTNYRYNRMEEQRVDYNHPGSILYKRTPQGMKAVGVMYTAPQNSTAEQLNVVAPLSIATFHRHVDFCGGPRSSPVAEQLSPNARFGMRGSIHTEEACREAHGLWIPVVFGWMTHVYPNAESPKDVWGGMHMHMDAGAGDEGMENMEK